MVCSSFVGEDGESVLAFFLFIPPVFCASCMHLGGLVAVFLGKG